MHFVHASCTVVKEGTREHGRWIREFWLNPGHRDWVEVDFERQEGPRSRPYTLPRLLVQRGILGELLGQEFLDGFEDPDALLALQKRCDALRAEADEVTWTTERRVAIEEAQEALEDAVYAARFRYGVVLVAFTDEAAAWLAPEVEAMNLADVRYLDFSARRKAFAEDVVTGAHG